MSTHFTQTGSAGGTDKEAIHTGRKFCIPARAPGWVQQHLVVPRKGSTGVLLLLLGYGDPAEPPPCPGKASAEEPLSAKVLPRHLLPQDGAGRGLSGVQSPPGHEWVLLLVLGSRGAARQQCKLGLGNAGSCSLLEKSRSQAAAGGAGGVNTSSLRSWERAGVGDPLGS